MQPLHVALASLLLLNVAWAEAMSPYMEQCKEAGVPLPPKWGDEGWKQQKPDLEKVFDADPNFDTPITEVWVYENELGFCYALPRKNKDGGIELLGIICQGKKSGKACFWDNVEPGTEAKIRGEKTKKLDPALIGDGSNLKENCTECHRGDNVFLITPRTALDLDPKKDGRTDRKTEVDTPPYQPLSGGRPEWINPTREDTDRLAYPGTGCSFCHSIPVVTEKYCRLLRAMVHGKVMPPSGHDLDRDEQEEVKQLKEECKKLGYVWED
jgi:hypothetical protein